MRSPVESAQGQTKYCFDTSALIEAWRDRYPPDIFGNLWQSIDVMVNKEEIFAPYDVLVELEIGGDELYRWASERKDTMFPEIRESVQQRAKELLKQFPGLVDSKKTASDADPIVIAMALDSGATVVTAEKLSTNRNKPKIPDVCQYYKVKCIGILEFIRERGWTF
jgi:predicted nucleic acid-binding protein